MVQAPPSLLSFTARISLEFYSLPHVTHRVKLHLRRVTHSPLSEVSAFLVLPAACSPSPLPFLISHLPSPRAPYIFDLSLSSLLSNPDTRGDTQAVWQHQGFTPRPWQVLGIPAVPHTWHPFRGTTAFAAEVSVGSKFLWSPLRW